MERRRRLRRAGSLLLAVMLLCMAGVPCLAAVGDKSDAIGWAKRGVVCIATTDSLQNPTDSSGGSGFGVGTPGKETDIFITNRHVVFNEDAGTFWPEIYILLSDGAQIYRGDARGVRTEFDASKVVRCEVLYPKAGDPEYPDFAILRAERPVEGRIALSIKSSQELEDGAKVYAIGYPGSADDAMGLEIGSNSVTQTVSADAGSSTLTEGTVSRALRFPLVGNTWVVQHTAHINHGNSGGPLLLADGTVVGINTYGLGASDGGIAEYNLAVFTDYAMNKLDELGIPYNQTTRRDYTLWIAAAVVAAVAAMLVVTRKKTPRPAIADAAGAAPAAQVFAPAGAPAFRLQGESGYFASRRFPIDGVVRVGRDPGRNDLVYPADTRGISGTHCRLSAEGGALYLEDLGSSYGTYFGGTKLAPGQRVQLQSGDVFYLGSPSESFRIALSGRN